MSEREERLALLERYHPHWPHSFRWETKATLARFALGLLEGSTWFEERSADGALLALAGRQELPWDSEKLGLRAARVAFIVPADSPIDRARFARRVVHSSQQEGFGYLFTRVDGREYPAVQACEHAGFATVDAILSQYVEVASAPRVPAPDGVSFREATAEDAALMSELVDATLHHSRFHGDPLVGFQRAREIYREWGANSVRGLNELTLIAELEGQAAGFISVKDNKAARSELGWGYGRVELVAVLERHRYRGLGPALFGALYERCPARGWDRLGIGSQIGNMAAVHAFMNAGFAPGDALFSMRWRVDDEWQR